MSRTIFLLLCIMLLGIPRQGYAIIVIEKSHASDTSTIDSKPRKKRHLSPIARLKTAHDNVEAERRRTGPNNNNRNGILSVSCIGLLLLAFAVIVVVTPTIPSGLAAILFGLSLVTSVLAIFFGARGIKRDRKRGLAMLGMVLGIIVLSIDLLLNLFLLAWGASLFEYF